MLHILTFDDSTGKRELYDEYEQYFGRLYANSYQYICMFELNPYIQYKQVTYHLVCCSKDKNPLTYVKNDLTHILKMAGDLYCFVRERANDLGCNNNALNGIYEIYVYRKCVDSAERNDQKLGDVNVKRFEHIPHIINKYDANISQDELVKRSSLVTFLAKDKNGDKYYEARLPDYGDPDQPKLSSSERKIRDLPEISAEYDLGKPICKVLSLHDWNLVPTIQHERSLATLPDYLFEDGTVDDYIMSTDMYRHPLIEKRESGNGDSIINEDDYHIMVVCIYKCPE
jgi:hypothetical protein